jgi:hypothetical protein
MRRTRRPPRRRATFGAELFNLPASRAFRQVMSTQTRSPMTTRTTFAGLAAALALAATPALAADPPGDNPNRTDNPGAQHRSNGAGNENKPATPGPRAGLPAKAKAYGRYCQGQSRKRSKAAEGTKGTPFSQCVTAMAKLAKDKTDSPRKACRALSRKRAQGEKRSPFSSCVRQGAKLLREQRARHSA